MGTQAHTVHEWTTETLTRPPPSSLSSLMREETPGLYSGPLSIWTIEKHVGCVNKEQRDLQSHPTFLSSGTQPLRLLTQCCPHAPWLECQV